MSFYSKIFYTTLLAAPMIGPAWLMSHHWVLFLPPCLFYLSCQAKVSVTFYFNTVGLTCWTQQPFIIAVSKWVGVPAMV